MKRKAVSTSDAKSHFSELLKKVGQGESFVITDRGKPIAELVPFTRPVKKPLIGLFKGKFKISDDFDAPLEDFRDYQ